MLEMGTELADKIQDNQLIQISAKTHNTLHRTYLYIFYIVYINKNLTGCPVSLFAKCDLK